MTTPRITRTGNLRTHGREAVVIGPDNIPVCLNLTAEETDVARSMHGESVRITIEPADATPEEAPHGSALDYLDELKSLLTGALEARGVQSDEQTDRALRRCLSLANSASLAILNERRK
jgi:hypothetical protein